MPVKIPSQNLKVVFLGIFQNGVVQYALAVQFGQNEGLFRFSQI